MTRTESSLLFIRDGVVVTATDALPATVVVEDGRVRALQAPSADLPDESDARTIDASGCYVLPGGVDPHVHVATSLGEYTTADGYAEASLAALAGGTTTLVDFAISDGRLSPREEAERRIQGAAGARCSVALHGCVTQAFPGDVSGELSALRDLGIYTVKLFTTYRDAFMATPDQMYAVLSWLRDEAGLTYVHAEWDPMVHHLLVDRQRSGRAVPAEHPSVRPPESEVVAVRHVLAMAEELHAPVYFVHLSTPRALRDVREARTRGASAYAETCTHYLTLTEAAYAQPSGAEFVCCPPLRDAETVAQLVAATNMGEVDAIGSDHCCFTQEQKYRHADDLAQMPYGLPGIEARLPVILDELVVRGKLSWSRAVDLLSATPARLNGLYPRKGTIAPGSDADIVIIDPRRNHRSLTVADLHMPTDVAPYAEHQPVAWPLWVIVGGKVAVEEGRLSDPGPGMGYMPGNHIAAVAHG